MNKDSSSPNGKLHQQILDFCRHIAGSAEITAVTLLGNHPTGTSTVKPALEVITVILDFQPRLMSYVKIINGRSIIFSAVDQWVFERDVDRGFLGEALAGTLILPHTDLHGTNYLHKQEITLKKRLIQELLENLVLSFPDLAHQLHIKPEYFMYEVIMNRVRIFPPLSYGTSNFMNGKAPKEEVKTVLQGYTEALNQLEKANKITLSDGYITIPKKLITESKKPKVLLTNISKNAPRSLFTSVLASFPQLLNFFSQNTEALLKLQKLTLKRESDPTRCFVDPQKYVFVPTAKGMVSLADRLNVEAFARKTLLNGEKGKIKIESIGGVLNDVYLIKAYPGGVEKKVLVKRFKDWAGFKWFPLSLWSFGARNIAVLGRTRLEKECAISEFLRCNGIRVPKILHVSHSERLVFMEYIEGEDLSIAIKRIAKAKGKEAEKDLAKIEKVGEVYAQVHALNITLGDTKPENVMFDADGNVYLLDFEQASHEGDKTWDVAVFLYYAGHYLQPLYSNGKAEAIAKAFADGYLKGGGDVATIKKVGDSKYTRIFSVFTMPSIMLAMSNVCKKTGKQKRKRMVKNKTTLTFYGGVDEIGGNKILLQDRDTKVFLDFGMSFAMKKQFYSPPFLSPKSEKSLQELGILPKISGVYKFDRSSPDVDAVFLSHGHLDHSAYLSFIKREIPVYCGETTRIILQALSDVRRADLEFRVSDIEFKTFRTGKKISVGSLEIEPFHVDHSVPGAYGFVIHTSNGAVVYTGDFRNHGAKPEMTRDFVENARKAEPTAIVTEATNMTGAAVSSETEVENKLNSIVGAADGIVLAEFAYSDVDRLNSFFHIAKKNHRCLAISLKQAYLLDALREDKGLTVPSLDDDEILIFRKSKKRFDKWESQLIDRYDKQNKIFDVHKVSKQQCKVVLAMSFYNFEELVHLQPEAGSCYVLSTSEPFNEEMEIDYDRLVNWMSHYGLPQYHVHVSGHMMPLQLKKALKEINAKQMFPIHTEHAGLFAKFMRDLNNQITLVEKSKEYQL